MVHLMKYTSIIYVRRCAARIGNTELVGLEQQAAKGYGLNSFHWVVTCVFI